jgi:hypothetical protein
MTNSSHLLKRTPRSYWGDLGRAKGPQVINEKMSGDKEDEIQ